MTLIQECGNCHFWAARSDGAGEVGGGYCRRFPPSFQSGLRVYENLDREVKAHHSFEINADGQYLNDGWPVVHQQSWCGEFQRKY